MCVEFPNKTRLENTLTSAYQVIVGILSQIELEAHTEDDLMYLFWSWLKDFRFLELSI